MLKIAGYMPAYSNFWKRNKYNMKFSPSKIHGFYLSSAHKSLNKLLEQDSAKTHYEKVEKKTRWNASLSIRPTRKFVTNKLEKTPMKTPHFI